MLLRVTELVGLTTIHSHTAKSDRRDGSLIQLRFPITFLVFWCNPGDGRPSYLIKQSVLEIVLAVMLVLLLISVDTNLYQLLELLFAKKLLITINGAPTFNIYSNSKYCYHHLMHPISLVPPLQLILLVLPLISSTIDEYY